MAGLILVVFGLVRMGGAIKFIPYPVTIGFTSGIALIIFSSQVRDLLGLEMTAVPAPFLAKWDAYARAFDSLNPWALLVATATFVIILVWPKIGRRVPGTFVALIVTTALVRVLHLPVETIGSRFGAINAGLPRPVLPHVTLPLLATLAAPAFTIALLGAIESLLSAVVADGMIGGRHRSNMELVAQGIANIASPLFGAWPRLRTSPCSPTNSLTPRTTSNPIPTRCAGAWCPTACRSTRSAGRSSSGPRRCSRTGWAASRGSPKC